MEGQPRSNDEQAIAAGIWEARAEDREIADDVARMIAAQLHSGQGSAFYSFASTGAIDYRRLRDELTDTYTSPTVTPRTREWLDFIGTYFIAAGDRGPQEGWVDRWREQ